MFPIFIISDLLWLNNQHMGNERTLLKLSKICVKAIFALRVKHKDEADYEKRERI